MVKSLYRLENIKLTELLRDLRERSGFVQTDLAVRLGRNQTFVSNVELGIRRLDVVELRDYCSGLNIELADFIARWEAAIGPVAKITRSKRKK